ncbi:MAG TPA: pitrilysin family protein [Kofleriaceae bacterium]|nr:pitrilysin family protein [Kofleriaceae bacterium]
MIDTAAALPFPVSEHTLASGLRVVAVKVESGGLQAYYSIVRTGSRNEVDPGKSGFAHFFEHMMFRGTERCPQEAYKDELRRIGASSNAATFNDYTVFHILSSSASLEKIVELEADRFRNLSYGEPAFQTEARAVLGEYNAGRSDPLQRMRESLAENAFTRHPYGHTVIGSLEDIEAMPDHFAYSRDFFDRHYRPDNAVLLVVGDVCDEQLFAAVERHYGGWGQGPGRPTIPEEPPQTRENRVALDWRGPTAPLLLEGWRIPAFSTENLDLQALDLLAELLFSRHGRLHRRLVLEEQTVESLSGASDVRVDPGLFTVLVRPRRPERLAEVEAAVDDEIARIAREGVDPRTLRDALSHVRYSFAHALSSADRVAKVGAELISLAGELGVLNGYRARFAEVTSEDVRRVAGTYFQPTSRTLVTLTGSPS